MIITGGFNVYCAEVEAGVMALPQVQECAVIGVPDDKWGEAVKALFVLRDGRRQGCQRSSRSSRTARRKLGGVKSPKSVEFWREIPKTPAGKIDKQNNPQAVLGRSWTGRCIEFAGMVGVLGRSQSRFRRAIIVTILRVPKTGGIPTTKASVLRWLKKEGSR